MVQWFRLHTFSVGDALIPVRKRSHMLCCRPSRRQKPSENRKSFGLVVALNSLSRKGVGWGGWAETSGQGGFWCAGRHLVAFGLQCNVTPFDRELANCFSDVLAELYKWPELEVKPKSEDSVLTFVYPCPHTRPVILASHERG